MVTNKPLSEEIKAYAWKIIRMRMKIDRLGLNSPEVKNTYLNIKNLLTAYNYNEDNSKTFLANHYNDFLLLIPGNKASEKLLKELEGLKQRL
jgi:hypothetical protein